MQNEILNFFEEEKELFEDLKDLSSSDDDSSFDPEDDYFNLSNSEIDQIHEIWKEEETLKKNMRLKTCFTPLAQKPFFQKQTKQEGVFDVSDENPNTMTSLGNPTRLKKRNHCSLTDKKT